MELLHSQAYNTTAMKNTALSASCFTGTPQSPIACLLDNHVYVIYIYTCPALQPWREEWFLRGVLVRHMDININ